MDLKGAKEGCFFAWLATRGVVLTVDNLRMWKVICINWCNMCKEADDDHLLLHYEMIMRLWWDMLRWFGTSWAMPNMVRELMFS